jgi:hypothetical protein
MSLNKRMSLKFLGIFCLALALFGNLAWAKEAPIIPNPDPVKYSWQIIDEAIQDHDPEKRRAIVVAASLGGPYEKVFAFLAKALKDKKVSVRLAACASLASFKDPRALGPLKEAVKDPVPEVFFCAAQGLFALGDPLGEKVLLEILEKEKGITSSSLSVHQRKAMAAFDSKRSFFSAIFHMGIRFAPVPGLAMGYNSMMELTKDHKAKGQALAAMALAHATDPESLKALVTALQDKSPAVRAAAVHSLAMRNDPSVRASLVPLLDDKAIPVRYRAAVAYLRLDHVAKEMQAQGATGQNATTTDIQE